MCKICYLEDIICIPDQCCPLLQLRLQVLDTDLGTSPLVRNQWDRLEIENLRMASEAARALTGAGAILLLLHKDCMENLFQEMDGFQGLGHVGAASGETVVGELNQRPWVDIASGVPFETFLYVGRVPDLDGQRGRRLCYRLDSSCREEIKRVRFSLLYSPSTIPNEKYKCLPFLYKTKYTNPSAK